ncbi:MAG TPA: SRPBCC domain-containing protein [Prolixibacteraceae bacterium]|nr:SRPBCC domain-containing protein [Prolixibacteraceae bacterium]
MENHQEITVRAFIHAPVEKVWECWVTPADIIHWNNATSEWHTPFAVNNLYGGGTFLFRMEAKDGSMGFDFEGTYQKVIPTEQIEYTIADGRKVKITFISTESGVEVIETFEAEQINSLELQQAGWQSILDHFKAYTESK